MAKWIAKNLVDFEGAEIAGQRAEVLYVDIVDIDGEEFDEQIYGIYYVPENLENYDDMKDAFPVCKAELLEKASEFGLTESDFDFSKWE